jgi:hypothetical protein
MRSEGVVIQGTIPPPLLADLLHVLAHQLGQLEHGDGRFPAKDRPQRRIRIDLAFVLGILHSPRHNYLYVSAELTRPCLFEASFTSNPATQRQDEASTREKPTYANLRGYDEPIRLA